jgi:carbonic anhydrase/acetyltransferase-like protein (isoleucine patch superfamily)
VSVGARTNLQDGVLVHVERALYPTVLGADVSVGHGAVLHGCSVGDGALIGMGARVLNDARIGAGAIVAAGAVVREGFEVPPSHLVAGVPATVKRRLEDHEVARVLRTARGYLMYKSRALAAGGVRLYHRRFEGGRPG